MKSFDKKVGETEYKIIRKQEFIITGLKMCL